MNALSLIRRMCAHAAWADELLLDALVAAGADTPAQAWGEYAHVLGAEAVWLARLEERPSPVPVWPTLERDEIIALQRELMPGYQAYLARIDDARLAEPVEYRNSMGQEFSTPPIEILTHVALHGQYHRGKINLLLRQVGAEPAPTDYISYVRGVPAAVTRLPG